MRVLRPLSGHLVSWLDATFYDSYRPHWHDWLVRQQVMSYLSPTMTALDLGAGSGRLPAKDFGHVAAIVHGIDLNPMIFQNVFLAHGALASAEALRYRESVFGKRSTSTSAAWTSTQIPSISELPTRNPEEPFFVKTPSRRHYVPPIASYTPHSFRLDELTSWSENHGHVADGYRG